MTIKQIEKFGWIYNRNLTENEVLFISNVENHKSKGKFYNLHIIFDAGKLVKMVVWFGNAKKEREITKEAPFPDGTPVFAGKIKTIKEFEKLMHQLDLFDRLKLNDGAREQFLLEVDIKDKYLTNALEEIKKTIPIPERIAGALLTEFVTDYNILTIKELDDGFEEFKLDFIKVRGAILNEKSI